MITLITGMPGNGKTLWTIWYVEQLRQKENRTVYYSGIPDLNLPWVEITDPAKWPEVPDGSIVVLDECQRLYRPRTFGATVPDYVSALETHRHHGLDLFLITQNPMLVDTNVRRLVGEHRHIVRSFGMGRATVHRWENKVKENPERDASRADSMKESFSYPKEVFGYYKSAEVHTHKRRVPARLLLIFVLPVVVALMGWRVYSFMNSQAAPKVEPQKASLSVARSAAGGAGGAAVALPVDYAQSRTPVVPGLPFTAPVYAEVTKPKRAPAPVACISSKSRCNCYTQDATKIPDMVEATCRSIVENGFFQDWVDPLDQRMAMRYQAEAPSTAHAAPVSSVAVMADAGASAADSRAPVVGGPSSVDQGRGVSVAPRR